MEFAKGNSAKRWAIALGGIDVTDAAPAGLVAASDPSVPTARISVSVALVPPPDSTLNRSVLHEVVAGEWPVDQIVGRDVTLTFAPLVPPEDALGHDLSNFPIRAPVLQLQSVDPLPDSVRPTYGGVPVSLSGAVYTPSPGNPNTLVGPYGPVPPALGASARAAARARSASLTVSANAGAFPDFDLDVSVLDPSGAAIPGLAAGDFTVTDDGVPVHASVISNTAPDAVRILVLYDTSGSVTDMWPSAHAKTDFETRLSNALVGAAAGAPYLVQVVGLGSSPAPAGWAAPNAHTLEAALASTASNSDVWASVGEVVPRSGASAAIMVSDCVSALENPTRVAQDKRWLAAAGVPIAVVPIGTPNTAAVTTIVSGSHGVQLDPAAAGALGQFVAKGVAQRLATPYRLRYRAPANGAAHRLVHVAITGRTKVAGDTSYDVPRQADRVAPSGVAGVYVSVTTGGVTDTRRLAGVELTSRGGLSREPTAADIAAATGVLNGITDVMADAPWSTDAARLDDAVAAALTLDSLRGASPTDSKALIAAAEAARRLPWLLEAMQEPVGAPGGVTPRGLAVHILTTVPSADGLDTRSDLPPALGTMIGTSSDPAAAFRAALTATVAASVRESEWMQSSAAAQLVGQKLVLAPTSGGLPAWSDATKAAFRPLLSRYDAFLRLVPESGAVTAVWVIDPGTGSATAVAADGSGGGTPSATWPRKVWRAC